MRLKEPEKESADGPLRLWNVSVTRIAEGMVLAPSRAKALEFADDIFYDGNDDQDVSAYPAVTETGKRPYGFQDDDLVYHSENRDITMAQALEIDKATRQADAFAKAQTLLPGLEMPEKPKP